MKRFIPLFALSLLVLAGVMTVFAFRVSIREAIDIAQSPELPEARPFTPPSPNAEPVKVAPVVTEKEVASDSEDDIEIVPEPEEIPVTPPTDTPEMIELVKEMNHGVPFTSQAPNADWSLPFQEACEETSLIMVNAWMVGTPPGVLDPDTVTGLILDLVAWQEDRFGYYEDTTAEETAIIAREFYGYKNSEVLPVASIDDVKQKIAEGYAVILPASGKALNNPYFSGDGPLYHMLVAKGFTEDGQIITNDPGTRRGADFLYDPDTLFEAIGDWNDGNPSEGEKLMIILKI